MSVDPHGASADHRTSYMFSKSYDQELRGGKKVSKKDFFIMIQFSKGVAGGGVKKIYFFYHQQN